MQILSQEALARLVDIPLPLVVAALVLAPVFWVLGWRLHRVLFVASVSLIAGMYGLVHGPKILGINEYFAGILLAVGVGGVAIALVRIGAFVACGLVADSIAAKVAPEYFDPSLLGPVRVVAFVAGGLLSVFFYRLVVVLITASLGAAMMVAGVVSLTHQSSSYDALAGGDDLQMIIAGAFVVLVLIGTGVQYLLAHRLPATEPEAGDDGEAPAEGDDAQNE